MPSIPVPEGYSYVLAAATSTVFLNMFQVHNVSKARRAAGVKYPQAYAEKTEADANPAAMKFNCAQRAHQNTLEHSAFIFYSILATGLKYPYLSAAFGGTWVLGRILYTIGYSTGNPVKRNQRGGFISFIGQFGLYLSAAYATFQFVKEGL